MDIFQYYGSDWLAVVLTFLATWQLGSKKRVGFITMMSANLGWMTVGYLTGSLAMIIANAVIFGMNLRAFVRW